MFTLNDMRGLLRANPFVPFKLVQSDGGLVEVLHRDFASAGRRYAVVGLVDPEAPDAPFDQHVVVWYTYVTRVEMMDKGRPPLSEPPPNGPAPAPSQDH
jgi:hypothetical protein